MIDARYKGSGREPLSYVVGVYGIVAAKESRGGFTSKLFQCL